MQPTLNHNVIFLTFHYLLTYALRFFFFGLVCDTLQFVPHTSVVLPSFLVVEIFTLLSFIHFIDHFCVIHGFLAFLTTFPAKSLIISNTRMFCCTSIFPLSHSFHQLFLALTAVQHVTSPNPNLIFPLGALCSYSI